MSKHFFDFEDGDFAHTISDNMAIDSDGDLLMRMGDNMAMDMDTGDVHIISSWSNDDEDDDLIESYLNAKIPLLILLNRGIHFRYKPEPLHLSNLMF